MGVIRKYKRIQEKKDTEEIRKTYGKKPKQKCPKCNKQSLFVTNKDNEVYCVRCNNRIK